MSWYCDRVGMRVADWTSLVVARWHQYLSTVLL